MGFDVRTKRRTTYLERAGTVVKDGAAYRLADGVEEKLESLDEERWDLAY